MAQEEMDVPATESDAPAAESDAPAAERELPTEVIFEHSVFNRVDDGVFRQSPDGEAVFAMRIGETEGSLSLPGIRREFGIEEGSPDAIMLDLVIDSLKFVQALKIRRPGPERAAHRRAVVGHSARALSLIHI